MISERLKRSRIYFLVFLILAVLYTIGFTCFEEYLRYNIDYRQDVLAIIAATHNIISTFFCAYVMLRLGKSKATKIWAISFIVVGIADFCHAIFHWVYVLSYDNLFYKLSGELYPLFMLLLLVAIYKTYNYALVKCEKVMVASIALFYILLCLYCITLPLIESDTLLHYKVDDTIYNVLVGVTIGYLLVIGMKTKNVVGLIFTSSYLLVFASGFALSALSYRRESMGQVDQTIFNYGWELGFSVAAATLAWVRLRYKRIGIVFKLVSFNSLRFQLSALCFFSIILLLVALRLLQIPDTFWDNSDISILLTLFLMTWITTNIAALWLSNKITSLREIVEKSTIKGSTLPVEVEQIVDIYRQKNAKLAEAKQIIESQKRSIEMTTHQIAHDVRRPLSGIRAILEILPEIKDDPSMLEGLSADVNRSVAQTNAMLSEMLEYSKEKIELDKSECDPSELIKTAINDSFLGRNNLNITIDYNLKHDHRLNVDVARLSRVFTNIISNALEAMDGKGKIWFRTEEKKRVKGEVLKDKEEGVISVVIGNNGPAISKDVQDKLFDPFFTKGKKGGTGLGLSICQKIVEMHGGCIVVKSCNVSNMADEYREPKLSGERSKVKGEGGKVEVDENITEFTIELPAGKSPSEVNEAELIHHSDEIKSFREEKTAQTEHSDNDNITEFMRIRKQKGRPFYLLIVDDEPLFRETVRNLLRSVPSIKDHVRIVEADSAEKALHLFKSRNFDYVIADIDLGDDQMDGCEMCKIILNKYRLTNVLIHSNKNREDIKETISNIRNDHFMGFLPKPMSQAELLQFLACKSFEAGNRSMAKGEGLEEERKRVLVVNDNKSMLITMRITLKKMGLDVCQSQDVTEALEIIKREKLDFILSDINLESDLNGYDLLEKAKPHLNGTKFYMLSGYSKSTEEEKAITAGATGYIQLPLDNAELKSILVSDKGVA